ncbi:hypothetical protein [Chromobacterium haemolyticum]|uniref:hypothetical protein n=1 Tax=Chromobacterium haemolyticum TaxID=394935 RepID=UPI001318001E|nr:hypothetical protein [Chromobacterium haemolyticum]BBH11778.1 hypothetical protein CH06BL_10260 [Chromobacterium haemolyticum]
MEELSAEEQQWLSTVLNSPDPVTGMPEDVAYSLEMKFLIERSLDGGHVPSIKAVQSMKYLG